MIVWRIAAYLVPDEGPEGWLRLALAGLGLLFVGCGLFVHSRSQSPATLLFALSALCSGLHWGGPIGSNNTAPIDEAWPMQNVATSHVMNCIVS